MILIDDLNRLI